MSSGKSQKKAEAGITSAGTTAYERGKATPEEEAQYRGSFDIGRQLQDYLRYQMGLGGQKVGLAPEEQYLQRGGELGKLLYEQTLAEAKDPYAFYQSTLTPQLQVVEDYINRQAQSRGLLRSGIPIEQMGRAGVELAIGEANARMQARSNALARAGGLTEYMQSGAQQNLANLLGLYGTQQQLGQIVLGRQASQAQAAAQYQAYPYQYKLGQGGGDLGGLGTGIGAGIGALLAVPTGGLSIPMGAAIGGAIGGGAGQMIKY